MNQFKLMILLAIIATSSITHCSFKQLIKPNIFKAIQRNMSLTSDKIHININKLESIKNQLLTDYIKHSKTSADHFTKLNHILNLQDHAQKNNANNMFQALETPKDKLTKSLPDLKIQHESMATTLINIQTILLNENQLQVQKSTDSK